MSQKAGKKLRKRLDDEVETKSASGDGDKKVQEDTVENGVESEEKCLKNGTTEETEVNGTNEDDVNAIDEVKEQLTEEIQESEDTKLNNQEDIVQEEGQEKEPDNKESEENEEKKQESKDEGTKIDESESKISTENEMEPLLLESEEADPELEFEESSDMDSQKSSPIIRARTRRSQTRNIPTPKTPKTVDTNSEDKVSECSDKPSIFTIPTPEVTTDTESEVSVFKPVTDIYDTNQKSAGKSPISEDFESFQNISTKAVIGSDTTLNEDLNGEYEFSPFLAESKDRPVTETLKCISGRKSIRSMKDYGLGGNFKREFKLLPSFVTSDKTGSVKRRGTGDLSPDYSKRFKSESPPNMFTYIHDLKNRFTKSEIPSSTPKLTGYKSKNVFDNTNVSKISLNESEEVSEKKWCTVM